MSGDQEVKKSYVVITRPDTHGNMYCVMPINIFSAADEFDGCEEGESIVLTFKLMTQTEFESLGEFAGW